jgi:hypothetical protein
MQDKESPFVRYRRLARESLKAANSLPPGEHRDALLQMAQVWQRLADQYTNSTSPFFQPDAPEQPVVRQQASMTKTNRDQILPGSRVGNRTDNRSRLRKHCSPAA